MAVLGLLLELQTGALQEKVYSHSQHIQFYANTLLGLYFFGPNPGHIHDQLITVEFQFFMFILIFLIIIVLFIRIIKIYFIWNSHFLNLSNS